VRRGEDVIGTEPCGPDPAYLPDLPTDPDAMLAYLYRNHSGQIGDANAIGKDIFFLLNDHYLLPARGRPCSARRPGIGVAWDTDGRSGMIVFDRTTDALLGVWAGRGASAVAEVAIVRRGGPAGLTAQRSDCPAVCGKTVGRAGARPYRVRHVDSPVVRTDHR
jgi:hypothetical protein